MPRKARIVAGGVCYHVVNRANHRARIFHNEDDHRYFVLAMCRTQEMLALEVFSVCLMPNHVHLVVRPKADGDLSDWMRRLMTTHVRWHHQRYETSGRLWQDRFKAFPIQQDRHLLTVMRYVERNAARAGLVHRAEEWPWTSLAWTQDIGRTLLTAAPVPLPRNWSALVDNPLSADELNAMRTCANRQRPFGTEAWVTATASRYNLGSTLRARGRPKKAPASTTETLDLLNPTPGARTDRA